MSEEFEREERAFAEALHASVPVESFRPLDPAAIKAAAQPAANRRSWFKGIAAAAAIVVAVGAGAAMLPRVTGSVAAAPAASDGYAAGGSAATHVPAQADKNGETVTAAEASSAPGPWTTSSGSPLSPRAMASGGWLAGKFYIVGGRGLQDTCSQLYCLTDNNDLVDGASYDPASDTWQRLPDAPLAVGPMAPTVVGTRLYYGDGSGSTDNPPSLAAFDTLTSAWVRIPSPANRGTLVAAGDRLINVAGSTPGVDQVYDPVREVWTDLPGDLLGDNAARSGAWANGVLYVTALQDRSTTHSTKVEAFDPSANTWRKLPAPRLGAASVRVAGDYLLVGGPGKGAASNGKEVAIGGRYNLATGTWSTWSEEPGGTPLVYAASGETVVSGRLLLHGRLYDPATDSYQDLVLPGGSTLTSPTVAGSPDGLLVFGGLDADHALSGETRYLPFR